MSPRRILGFEGRVLPPDEIYESREHINPEVKKVLEKVDFKLLRSLFEKIARRCGINGDDFTFIEKENIISEDKNEQEIGPRTLAIYDFYNDAIIFSDDYDKKVEDAIFNGFDSANTFESRRIYGIDPSLFSDIDLLDKKTLESLKQLFFLNILIHEEAHVFSYNELSYWQDNNTFRKMLKFFFAKGTLNDVFIKSGYSRQCRRKSYKDGDIQEDGWMQLVKFDESVNEKIARLVLFEYLKIDSEFVIDKRVIDYFCSIQLTMLGYTSLIKDLDEMIKSVSEVIGVPEETIFGAILRGKVEGIDIEDSDVLEFFKRYVTEFEDQNNPWIKDDE